ncbi:MAG: peptidoglycan recognition family protein [Bacteroidota bacterium]
MFRFLRTGALALVPLLFASCLAPRSVEGVEERTHGSMPSKVAATDTLPGITLVSRREWGAQDPIGEMRPHTPVALTIHHTATPQAPDRDPRGTLRNLQRFSISSDTLDDGRPKLPWPDVPYHYYIAPDGTIVEGRDVRFEGDTNTGYDLTGQVQVVVEGNFMAEEPTAEQVASLVRLAGALSTRWGIPPSRVMGHRDHEGRVETSCPGDALAVHFPAVLAAMTGG